MSHGVRFLNGRISGDSLWKPTYHGKNGFSTVDYIITDQDFFNFIKYFLVEQPIFLSDHSLISTWIQTTWEIFDSGDQTKQNLDSLQTISPQFIWTPESTEPFKNAMSSPEVKTLIHEFLAKDFNELTDSETVESAIKCVNTIFITAASKSLKLTSNKRKKRKNVFCNKKWFDFECRKARKELRQYSNQKHSDPSNLFLRQMYHQKLKRFKNLLKSKRHNFQTEKRMELENNSGNSNFWKILKSANEDIQGDKIPPISEQEWIDHFTSLHSRKEVSRDQQFVVESLTKMESDPHTDINTDLNCLITKKEIETCSKMLKNGKSASFDKIRNEMIRHSISEMGEVFKKLFNIILYLGVFPDNWCVGSITPIYKNGEHSDTNNYRGICVSSCLGKFFAVILNQRLLKLTQKHNLLHKSQIGFLPKNRTSDHIFTLRCIIDRYVTNTSGGKIYACFIDFKKAFDSIWHEGLLFKLLQNNINGNFYKIIKNLYSKSSCFIKLGCKRTKTFQYTRGVRQGCILSPLLFNLYLNDLSILLDKTPRTDPIFLPNGNKLTSLMYADDLVLLSKSKEGLQNCINSVTSFCTKWQMTINEKKSKVMIFSKKTFKKSKQHSFILQNNKLEIVKEYTYLGVKLSSTGNFSAHLLQSKEKALHAFFNINRTVDFTKLKPQQANKLFDSMISPILTYASEIWGVYQKHDFEKWEKSQIEKANLRFCKFYLGVGSKASNIACRAELGRFPLKICIDKLILKYFNHLFSLPDSSFAKQAFLMSKSLHEQHKPCYHSNFLLMLNSYNIEDSNILNNPILNITIQRYYESMKIHYFKAWKSNLTKSRKLQLYNSIKKTYETEDYLNTIANFDQRRCFTKLRISNHKLAIETGRYGKQKVEVEHRLCIFCNQNQIETEEHMLLQCSLYSNLRSNLYNKIADITDINNLDISTLLSSNNPAVYYISKFILKAFELRNSIAQDDAIRNDLNIYIKPKCK